MIAIGGQAPDFTLRDKDGKEVSLASFRGHYAVLYFYPKDGTSGCTLQAKGYRDLFPEFVKESAAVIGISKDDEASHIAFAAKNDLPFLLLSDPEKKAIRAYEAWGEKNMYGKKAMGVIRSSFLIDPNGKIAAMEKPASPIGNAQRMLDVLKKAKYS